jgi:hypothetical protein
LFSFRLFVSFPSFLPYVLLRYLIAPSYIFGLPFLYMHMLAQRKKVLGGGGKKPKGSGGAAGTGKGKSKKA